MQPLMPNDVSWVVRLLPKRVVSLLKKYGSEVFVAGGFIRAAIAGERPNDVDIFAPSKDHARLYATELADGRKIHETDNAFTVRHQMRFPAQVIHRWTFTRPEDALLSFDFTIACAAIWFDSTDLSWHSLAADTFYPDLAAKRLIYTSPRRNEDAGGSMLRVLKFYKAGYRIPLDSLGAVISRLVNGVDTERLGGLEGTLEERWSRVLTSLLVEVDPAADPEHIAHLPAVQQPGQETGDAEES